jgi:prepilin peptidase CpaA
MGGWRPAGHCAAETCIDLGTGRKMFALNSFINELAIISFAGLLCWAAISDISRFVIPNTICLGIVALFPAYVLSAPGPIDWVGNIVTASIMFGIGFVFFIFRLTGGGDVKMLVAASLWAGPALIMPFLVAVAMAGGVLSLLTMTRLKVFRLRPASGPSFGVRFGSALKAHVPYGVAIAAGGLLIVFRLQGV